MADSTEVVMSDCHNVTNIAADVLADIGVEGITIDGDGRRIDGTTKRTWNSWGQRVQVKVRPLRSDMTSVTIVTKPKGWQFLDWHEGDRLRQEILERITTAAGTSY